MMLVFDHLWQSTVFAALIGLLVLALRKNHARWRYRLWMAASVKFLLPFTLLVRIGRQFGWRTAHTATSGLPLFLEEFTRPFSPGAAHQVVLVAPPAAVSILPWLPLALWLGGFAFVLLRWGLSWMRIRAVVRAAVPMPEGREWQALRRLATSRPIPLLSSPGRIEPGVFGLFRPVLLWPAGISDRLADSQLEAILAHEVCHVRRHDNLAALLHMFVEAVFWFHPLVWWLGARLVDERENACDEEVLSLGSVPQVYAESILRTCQFYLESPLVCMAGVTGSDLKKRIERIMTHRAGRGLDASRKLLLAVAAIAAVAGPILFGVANAPPIRAQSTSQPAAARPAFDVASIKPNRSDDNRISIGIRPGGRFSATGVSPQMLMKMAFNLKSHQLEGAPNWLDTEKYDIEAKAEGPADRDQIKLMVQSLLADRFKLAFHRETREMNVYALVAGKNGPKLEAAVPGTDKRAKFRLGPGQLDLEGATLAQFADSLSDVVDRNVLDRTGITGVYKIKLEWTPEEGDSPMFHAPGNGPGGPPAAPAPDAPGPSIFTAVQEQLGLKLEAQKGPVEVMVIDHIEKASGN